MRSFTALEGAKRVLEYNAGSTFGELSVLFSTLRAATIKALLEEGLDWGIFNFTVTRVRSGCDCCGGDFVLVRPFLFPRPPSPLRQIIHSQDHFYTRPGAPRASRASLPISLESAAASQERVLAPSGPRPSITASTLPIRQP